MYACCFSARECLNQTILESFKGIPSETLVSASVVIEYEGDIVEVDTQRGRSSINKEKYKGVKTVYDLRLGDRVRIKQIIDLRNKTCIREGCVKESIISRI